MNKDIKKEMKSKALHCIFHDMRELSNLVQAGRFTYDGVFDYGRFRKYQRKIYGKLELSKQLEILSGNEFLFYRRHARRIGIHYRNNF